jgi:uncharacterized protein YndB with AHSA1/START domain
VTGAAVVVSHRFAVAVSEVFDAWASPDVLARWMSPFGHVATEVDVDFRVGGRFRFAMHGPDGDCEVVGEYVEITRPHRLVFTWRSSTTEYRVTLVAVEFRDLDGETEVAVTHRGIPSAEARGGYDGGWAVVLGHLDRHFARPSDVAQAERVRHRAVDNSSPCVLGASDPSDA